MPTLAGAVPLKMAVVFINFQKSMYNQFFRPFVMLKGLFECYDRQKLRLAFDSGPIRCLCEK